MWKVKMYANVIAMKYHYISITLYILIEGKICMQSWLSGKDIHNQSDDACE